ncbi:hypothetical protein DPMN_098246 [Dreissena polymorpha]|uniref:Uncharacterized protein n=1 Tax=Dreissena polymorpha TaxID=45954 RepID=A0A9D4R5B0_DREPO|nr:hypothetical protein DPMN_098246 [Dreissena polymorpha]
MCRSLQQKVLTLPVSGAGVGAGDVPYLVDDGGIGLLYGHALTLVHEGFNSGLDEWGV